MKTKNRKEEITDVKELNKLGEYVYNHTIIEVNRRGNHLYNRTVIDVQGEVGGRKLNAREREKLMETPVVEETFEEAGQLVSQREAIREPRHNSRLGLKAREYWFRNRICKSKGVERRERGVNSKHTPAKIARTKDIAFVNSNKFEVYNSWENFEKEDAIYEELLMKDFPTRDVKHDFRPAVQQINAEQAMRIDLLEKLNERA